ncbi:GerAB/ArcD/ProY family transporter [Sediminibacillus albus]|uniref:GerAB/ArcD/ProY family transporter n=1 Tax=Sediminibacillus albus TaxID=407036 RepID=UPI000B86F7E0|nr:GerAB/ArcD/ProY family transporter [Sediminibacillus albus]
MNPNVVVKPNLRIKAFYLFFIITSLQTGSGIMGVPRYIFMEAKQDAWISVLIAGGLIHLVVAVMLVILNKYENADILGIQMDIFGKWIGKLLGTGYIIYFFFVLVSVLVDYIQVIQIFVFPRVSPWLLSLMLILLIIYAVSGGLRVAVGVTFLFFFFSLWLLIFLYKPISLMDFEHFQPVLQASPAELLRGARKTVYSYIGLEILFFIYPFIDNKRKAKQSAHLGVLLTTFLILLVTVICIGYFSGRELVEQIWPVLVLFKIVEYAIIGRFDVLVVTEWMMVILPNIIFLTWMITYSMKRLYKVPQRKALYAVGATAFVGAGLVKNEVVILNYIDRVATAGFWIAFVYPMLLFPIVLIKRRKYTKQKDGKD